VEPGGQAEAHNCAKPQKAPHMWGRRIGEPLMGDNRLGQKE